MSQRARRSSRIPALVTRLALAGVALLSSRVDGAGFAVLPASAADIRAGDVAALDELDRALHAAAVQQVGASVQAMATTRAHVDAARTLGVQCGPVDLECLKRLAILAEVDAVLAPAARRNADGWDVDLTLVDVRQPPSASVNRRVQDGSSLASSCRLLVEAALHAPPAPVAPPAPLAAVAPSTVPVAPTSAGPDASAERSAADGTSTRATAPSASAPSAPAASPDASDGAAWWVVGAGVGAAVVAAGAVAVVLLAAGAPVAPPVAPSPEQQRGSAVVVLP